MNVKFLPRNYFYDSSKCSLTRALNDIKAQKSKQVDVSKSDNLPKRDAFDKKIDKRIQRNDI